MTTIFLDKCGKSPYVHVMFSFLTARYPSTGYTIRMYEWRWAILKVLPLGVFLPMMLFLARWDLIIPPRTMPRGRENGVDRLGRLAWYTCDRSTCLLGGGAVFGYLSGSCFRSSRPYQTCPIKHSGLCRSNYRNNTDIYWRLRFIFIWCTWRASCHGRPARKIERSTGSVVVDIFNADFGLFSR